MAHRNYRRSFFECEEKGQDLDNFNVFFMYLQYASLVSALIGVELANQKP